MKKIYAVIILGLIAGLMTTGCSRAPKVTRTETSKVIDLSGRWNDTDSRFVAEEMIKDALGRPWFNHFQETHANKMPVVIVGTIKNRSQEHIDAELFVKNLERSLINSGKVNFVASTQERGDVREERDDQIRGGYTEPGTINPKGKETGANFMLIGSIHSVVDEIKGKFVILYQVNLELVDLTNNQKVWIGEKQIKKLVERSQYSW